MVYRGNTVGEGRFSIVVAINSASKEEDHVCRMILTDVYLESPAIVTGASNKAKLELLDANDNVILSTGDLVCTSARDDPMHVQRKLNGMITKKITTDGNVGANETFYVTLEGIPLGD